MGPAPDCRVSAPPRSEGLSGAPLAALPGQSPASRRSQESREAPLRLQVRLGQVLPTAAAEWWLHQIQSYSL